jgi:hypothetical protein
MSDEEVMKIIAPPRAKTQGQLKEKRFLSFLDKVEKTSRSKNGKSKNGIPITSSNVQGKQASSKGRNKKRAQATSTKITPHCKICKKAGHNKTRCPKAAGCLD